MIYLDNAATTLHKPQQVIDAVVHAMQSMGNCSRGTHEGALDAARTVYGARVNIAKLCGIYLEFYRGAEHSHIRHYRGRRPRCFNGS